VLQRGEHRQAGQLDAIGAQVGAGERAVEALDAVDASGGHQDALLRRAVAIGRLADAAVVHDELVERHRQQVRRHVVHGAVEVAPGQRGRQLDHPHHQAWVGKADAHVVGQLVLGEERAQLDRELVGVDDLAVDDESDGQWMDDCAAHTRALGSRRLQDDDGVGTDVEGDRR
jgi:hypothetical protein